MANSMKATLCQIVSALCDRSVLELQRIGEGGDTRFRLQSASGVLCYDVTELIFRGIACGLFDLPCETAEG
jgi:hypothetical protein